MHTINPQVKEIEKNNPFVCRDVRTTLLNDAYHELLSLLEEYLQSNNNISDEEIDVIKHIIKEAYFQKRASYFISNRLSAMTNYLSYANSAVLKSEEEDSDDYTELIYLNHHKFHKSNEQF
ncbi:hypothetical protein ACDQ55_07775 [Chitinophaga sp. 30R24]|uniref:hypothetical protein n=1 Tax=Chitinophaga sp. 30R24 TaxID=3248838 RepID=UPI003B8EF6FF